MTGTLILARVMNCQTCHRALDLLEAVGKEILTLPEVEKTELRRDLLENAARDILGHYGMPNRDELPCPEKIQ